MLVCLLHTSSKSQIIRPQKGHCYELVSRSCRLSLLSSPKLAALLLVAGASFMLAGSASAQTVKITTTGTITEIGDAGLLNSSVQVGIPFTYSFLFNYSAAHVFDDFGQLTYQDQGTPYGATVTFGDYGFAPNADASVADIALSHNQPSGPDFISFAGSNETATGFSSPITSSGVGFFGYLTNNSILSSDALPPLSVYNLANFHNAALDGFRFSAVLHSDFGQTEIRGTATSLSAELVNPVPEASTTVSLGLLLALGLGGVVIAARRRKA